MLKINLLSVILIFSLLSACNFHISENSAPINVSVMGNANSIFVTELKKHLSINTKSSLHIEIGNEVQRNQTIAYRKDGGSSSYMLTLNVPIKVLRGQKVLLLKNLTASTTIKEMTLSQADTLQIKYSFSQLRKTVITKLMRILTRLNAN